MRPRALAFLMVVPLALAGCLAPAANIDPGSLDSLLGPTASVVHGPDGVLTMLDGVERAVGGQYFIGARASEPTVGVTSDGTLFMTGFAPGLAPGRSAPTILRSMDQGMTWEVKGPKVPVVDAERHPLTNDPYVYVDPATDRVFMLDLIGTVCSILSWSDDLGETWTTNPLACGTPLANDHQTIVAATPRMLPTVGYANVVYYCVNRVADSACATSLDGGLTFGPLRTFDPGAEPTSLSFCGGLHGHVKAGPDGKVFVPKPDCVTGGPAVHVTEDDGLTWRKSVIDTTTEVDGHEVAIAIDEENNVYASWQANGLHYLAVSTDGAQTWTAPRLLTPPGVTATEFNAIAAGKPGHVVVAYIGSTVEGGYEGKPTGNPGLSGDIFGQPELPEWDQATWNAYLAVITDALDPDFTIQTVTANDPADPIARGLCGHTRCGGMTDFISVVIDPEGRPWASFVDVCHEECRNAEKPQHDRGIGFVATLREGPALRGDLTRLPPLAPQPALEG